MRVSVRDNNVDQALKILKKKLQREGVFREMKLKQHFEKPSEKITRKKEEGIRRARKIAVKAFVKSGLTKEEAIIAVRNNEPRPPKIKGPAPR